MDTSVIYIYLPVQYISFQTSTDRSNTTSALGVPFQKHQSVTKNRSLGTELIWNFGT